ncbi:MAG TPA: ATP-binding protein [Candidatus Gracilibacteria bacterium]|nr:ATP-binding protein [Candidatus Gracilibacteria bacterium]
MLTRLGFNNIEKWLFKNKILILYGARQVGKTTMSKQLVEKYQGLYLNCEKTEIKKILETRSPEIIKGYIGKYRFVVLDEAQVILGIGEILKLLIDTFPDLQILATGSSSFDLANRTQEPLTGRKITFSLYPISLTELDLVYNRFEIQNQLEKILIYGMYPEILLTESNDEKRIKLQELSGDYLYKDVLQFENLKKSDLLRKLLQALALQLGSEVSYRELSALLNTSVETIIRYIELLEKSFVIFRLSSFSRNLRNELSKKNKIYFYDLGIRNSIINNFNDLNLRTDRGALWENFCVLERKKYWSNQMHDIPSYFWRTHQQKEIDYLEDFNGKLLAFEFKWNAKKQIVLNKEFAQAYPNSNFQLINSNNYWKLIGDYSS